MSLTQSSIAGAGWREWVSTMTARENAARDSIADEAADWFVEHDEGPLDERRAVELAAWLRTSPAHVEAFLRVAALSRELPRAAGDPQLPIESVLLDMASDRQPPGASFDPPRPRRRWRARRLLRSAGALAAIAASIAAAVLVYLGPDGQRFGLPLTCATAHGEQRAWTLADGSRLWLNSDGRAVVRYDANERVVTVERGEALFDVAHGDERRFRVAAGATQIVAVGTQFDVYRHSQTTLVTVVDGAVAVSIGAPPATSPVGVLPAGSARVGAGQQLGVDPSRPLAEPRPVDAKASIAWLQHQIVARAQPLGEVVAEFNRYASAPIEIESPELKALPISGRFDVYDTESFTAFLRALDGVTVEVTSSGIRVRRTTPPTAAAKTTDEPHPR